MDVNLSSIPLGTVIQLVGFIITMSAGYATMNHRMNRVTSDNITLSTTLEDYIDKNDNVREKLLKEIKHTEDNSSLKTENELKEIHEKIFRHREEFKKLVEDNRKYDNVKVAKDFKEVHTLITNIDEKHHQKEAEYHNRISNIGDKIKTVEEKIIKNELCVESIKTYALPHLEYKLKIVNKKLKKK